MSALHAHFHLRSLQAFQRLLDGSDRGSTPAAVSGSPRSKSWKGTSTLKTAMTCDVNGFDWLGRTTLHLACAAPDGIEYVRALLKHPFINVNLMDAESRWTSLHRALYHGNLAAALLLSQRSDIDTSLKDLEGLTPFDLYNSTIHGTAPSPALYADLHTWGVNRNAALGLVDSGDRLYPDQVVIPRDGPEPSSIARFSPLFARQIQMSKLHTVVVTSERKSNLRVCGFGSGGRLGPGQHTQYRLVPLPHLPQSTEIVAVALGQDHTLALTSTGEVLSWGLSRFHQLGYAVEPSATTGKLDEPIQATPRKIYGPLKKEAAKGIAASKQCSACWTATEVFTWGTNNGQLGYDKAAQPFQVVPRKVSKVVRPVMAISLTDHAMACLLDTQEVVCIWNDRYIKIIFPGHAFPAEIQPYRPPQAMKLIDAHIAKITSCEDTIAALSSNGELFTFSVPDPSETDGSAGRSLGFKPQRVWALRKQFSAVRDVALGADGSIIICTESGHVFVRSRSGKTGQGNTTASNKTFKFQRVPFIQRVTQVCANSTGAFGALRVDFKPESICIKGNTIAEDLATIQPYLAYPPPKHLKVEDPPIGQSPPCPFEGEQGEESEDVSIEADFGRLWRLCRLLKTGAVKPARHGADAIVCVLGKEFPVHQVILAARTHVLCTVFGGAAVRDGPITIKASPLSSSVRTRLDIRTRLDVKGCAPMTVLILLQYLYSDELLAIWDRRLTSALQNELTAHKIKPAQVKLELQNLARVLDLPLLGQALDSPAKRVPASSVARDMEQLFHAALPGASPTKSPVAADVVLQLADKDVYCHSTILRARSPIFASFFDEDDWTAKRWETDGTVKVNFKHLRWHVMEYVFKYMYCGSEEIFEELAFARSVDDVLELMFDVMAAANELLLDRLVLLCSWVILRFMDINNACYILADASHFHAHQLVESVQGYVATNMETMLESRMLDDLAPALIDQLAGFVSRKQTEKSPRVRTNFVVNRALAAHKEWLALQDIPEPIVPSFRFPARKAPLSPDPNSKSKRRWSGAASLSNSPVIAPQVSSSSIDEIFEIDDAELVVPLVPLVPQSNVNTPAALSSAVTAPTAPVWKAASVPRVDMKTVMAEAALLSAPRREPNGAGDSSLRSKTIQGTRRMLPAEFLLDSDSAYSSPGPSSQNRSGTPSWRPSAARTSSAAPTSSAPITPSTSRSSQDALPAPSIAAVTVAPTTPPRQRGPQAPQPTLGPVFTPTRQPNSRSAPYSTRRVSSNSTAWVQPPAQAAASPSPVPGASFVAIQQLQLEQGQIASSGRDKRSLLEIQEEETARRAEEDFLKWWAAEEERARAEAATLSRSRDVSNNNMNNTNNHTKSARRGRKPKNQRPPLPGPILSASHAA